MHSDVSESIWLKLSMMIDSIELHGVILTDLDLDSRFREIKYFGANYVKKKKKKKKNQLISMKFCTLLRLCTLNSFFFFSHSFIILGTEPYLYDLKQTNKQTLTLTCILTFTD